MAIKETDKGYLKKIGIATAAFVGFLIAYSFFTPLWAVAALYRPSGIGEFHKQLEAEMPKEFALERLQKISGKAVLFVNGDKSPKFLIRIIELLASKLPKAERFVIPNVTHDLGLASKPETFNSKVLEFLAKN